MQEDSVRRSSKNDWALATHITRQQAQLYYATGAMSFANRGPYATAHRLLRRRRAEFRGQHSRFRCIPKNRSLTRFLFRYGGYSLAHGLREGLIILTLLVQRFSPLRPFHVKTSSSAEHSQGLPGYNNFLEDIVGLFPATIREIQSMFTV